MNETEMQLKDAGKCTENIILTGSGIGLFITQTSKRHRCLRTATNSESMHHIGASVSQQGIMSAISRSMLTVREEAVITIVLPARPSEFVGMSSLVA